MGTQLRSIATWYMAYNNEKKDKLEQNQKSKFLLDNCLSPKSINYSTKTIKIFRYAFFQRCAFSQLYFFPSTGFVKNLIIWQGNKMNIKYAIMLKSKGVVSKQKRPLVKHKTVTDIKLKPKRNRFLPVFTETAPGVERNKIK